VALWSVSGKTGAYILKVTEKGLGGERLLTWVAYGSSEELWGD